MGYVRFKGSPDVFQMQIKTIGSNMVQLYPPLPDVGRILRTFKIKKNVEVTDNGKIII